MYLHCYPYKEITLEIQNIYVTEIVSSVFTEIDNISES